MTEESATLVNPKWRPCSGRRTVDGVLFKAYASGILQYTNVSEDGKIRLASHNHGGTYSVEVLGHGWITSGIKSKRFRTFETAARAGIKMLRQMQEKKS